VPDKNFGKKIQEIKKAADDYLIDNVYCEAKMPPRNKKSKIKTHNRRTQTYLRELL